MLIDDVQDVRVSLGQGCPGATTIPLGPPVTWLASVLAEGEPQATRRARTQGRHSVTTSKAIGVKVSVRPATQASMLGFRRLKQTGKNRLTALGCSTPKPPQGGCGAGPSNITRHYAKWPHARASHRSAATSHNTALCVNGPEGIPQTPPGLTQGGEQRRLKATAFKSIPAHLGNLGPAAPAAQTARVFRSRRAKLAHPREKQNQVASFNVVA